MRDTVLRGGGGNSHQLYLQEDEGPTYSQTYREAEASRAELQTSGPIPQIPTSSSQALLLEALHLLQRVVPAQCSNARRACGDILHPQSDNLPLPDPMEVPRGRVQVSVGSRFLPLQCFPDITWGLRTPWMCETQLDNPETISSGIASPQSPRLVLTRPHLVNFLEKGSSHFQPLVLPNFDRHS